MSTFEELFVEQVANQVTHYNGDPSIFDDEAHAEYVTWNALAAIDELTEVLGLMSWKPWSVDPGSKRPDVAKVAGEVADELCFLVNIARAAGVRDGGELMDAWAEKIERNRARQEASYDASSPKWKCVVCGGELDSADAECGESEEYPGLWRCEVQNVYVRASAPSPRAGR